MKRVGKLYKGTGAYATVGLEIAFAIVIAMFVGSWVDGRYGTEPYGLWLGFAFGVATGVHSVVRAMRMLRVVAEREEREEGNPTPRYETKRDRAVRRREARAAQPGPAPDEGAG